MSLNMQNEVISATWLFRSTLYKQSIMGIIWGYRQLSKDQANKVLKPRHSQAIITTKLVKHIRIPA